MWISPISTKTDRDEAPTKLSNFCVGKQLSPTGLFAAISTSGCENSACSLGWSWRHPLTNSGVPLVFSWRTGLDGFLRSSIRDCRPLLYNRVHFHPWVLSHKRHSQQGAGCWSHLVRCQLPQNSKDRMMAEIQSETETLSAPWFWHVTPVHQSVKIRGFDWYLIALVAMMLILFSWAIPLKCVSHGSSLSDAKVETRLRACHRKHGGPDAFKVWAWKWSPYAAQPQDVSNAIWQRWTQQRWNCW